MSLIYIFQEILKGTWPQSSYQGFLLSERTLFVVAPILCGGLVLDPCFVVIGVLSSFAIILKSKRIGCFTFFCVVAVHVPCSSSGSCGLVCNLWLWHFLPNYKC